jgi:hypothetical protein
MTTAIDAAIAAAKNAASAAPASDASVPATYSPAGTSIAAPRRITMGDVAPGLAVDVFPKKDLRGIKIGDAIFEKLIVGLTPSEVVPAMGAKWAVGSTTFYATTYDHVTDRKSGKPWDLVIANAEQQTGKEVRPYATLEIPLEVLEDGVPAATSKDKTKLSSGLKLGFTSATTGFKAHYKAVEDASRLNGADVQSRFELTVEAKEKPGVQPWPEFKLTYIGLA